MNRLQQVSSTLQSGGPVSTRLSLFSLVPLLMFACNLRYILYVFLHRSPFHSLMCRCIDGTYAATIGSILNYLLRLALQIDRFYLHFELFNILGLLTLLGYRLGQRNLFVVLSENFCWIPSLSISFSSKR